MKPASHPNPPGAAASSSTPCSRRRPRVQLGNNWRLFATVQPGLAMLGSIQSGLEIGALALAGENRYVQVNGSAIRDLSAARVEAAIERARPACRARPAPRLDEAPVKHLTPAVSAVVYTRRRLAAADLEALPR